MLKDLYAACATDAVIFADTVDPTLMTDKEVKAYQDRMTASGEYVGNVTLRFH